MSAQGLRESASWMARDVRTTVFMYLTSHGRGRQFRCHTFAPYFATDSDAPSYRNKEHSEQHQSSCPTRARFLQLTRYVLNWADRSIFGNGVRVRTDLQSLTDLPKQEQSLPGRDVDMTPAAEFTRLEEWDLDGKPFLKEVSGARSSFDRGVIDTGRTCSTVSAGIDSSTSALASSRARLPW